MSKLAQEFEAFVRHVRAQLQDHDMANDYVHIMFTASGRANSMVVAYHIGDLDKSSTKGNDPYTVLDEYIKRRHWDERNQPMPLLAVNEVTAITYHSNSLSNVDSGVADPLDDIPS